MRSRLLLFLVILASLSSVQAQDKDALEQRLSRLRSEISQINSNLRNARDKKASVVTVVNTLDQKISRLEELIRVTNRRMNQLTALINENQEEITKQRTELKNLKEDYAAMIRRSYKSRGDQSRVMFLMSSENFLQAYKRMQYMNQYAVYRREQGQEIAIITQELQKRNNDLLEQKKDKQELVRSNEDARRQLRSEKKEQQALLAEAKKQETVIADQLRERQREANRINRQIQKLIEAEIARSNAKSGATASSKTFALSPQAKRLAANFASNKGKLPWPVRKGLVTMKYGQQTSPIARQVKIDSKGWRFQTEAGEQALSIFDGEVMRVQKQNNGILTVILKHGNYITVYNRLSSVSVAEGDTVKRGDALGTIFTSQSTGITELKFNVLRETKFQDPGSWLIKR